MKKRRIFAVAALMVFLVLTCGASLPDREIEVCFFVDDAAFAETIRVPFFTALKVSLFHRGSYENLCENNYSGNPKECIKHLNWQFCDELEEMSKRLARPPVDAWAEFRKGKFTYIEGGPGRETDEEKLFADVLRAMYDQRAVNVAFLPVEPLVTVEKLKDRTVKRGSFFTDYSKSAEGRKRNVELACEKIDGAMVYPGEKFRFNERVGERTEENGFSSAKIIVDGAFVEGVGGGVCQVSTTLYDAWLTAGLAVERAAAHSLPVSYVSPSLDAMVSSSNDLVLLNDSANPVYLYAEANGRTVKVEVYGEKNDYTVKLRSVVERILPAEYDEVKKEGIDWQEGEYERIVKRGTDGKISVSYRDFYRGKTLVKSEFLRRNVYKSQAGEKVIKAEN